MAKILLVDDAAFMRMMVKDTLTKAGYTDLYEAADGLQAVETYAEIQPDLVIMDITMPNMADRKRTALKRSKRSRAKTPMQLWSCVPRWARRVWSLKPSNQEQKTLS